MKIIIEEYWQVGSMHFLDAVIIRDIASWDYQQLVYDEITKRFSKDAPW